MCSSSIILKPLALTQKQQDYDLVTHFTIYSFPTCPSLLTFFFSNKALSLCKTTLSLASIVFRFKLVPFMSEFMKLRCYMRLILCCVNSLPVGQADRLSCRHELRFTCAGCCSRKERGSGPWLPYLL